MSRALYVKEFSRRFKRKVEAEPRRYALRPGETIDIFVQRTAEQSANRLAYGDEPPTVTARAALQSLLKTSKLTRKLVSDYLKNP